VSFDRTKAIDYARKHWTTPCDDGILWLDSEMISIEEKRRELKAPAADGWQPKFVRYTDATGSTAEKAVFQKGTSEILINDWAGIADCAHYLSRCLQAGGAKVNERGVHSLVMALQERADTRTLCDRVTKDAAQRIIDTGIFKNGDMLGYFNIKPDGDYGQIRYTHSTMFAGKTDPKDAGRITCHSMCRFPGLSDVEDRWFLKDGYKYTLIHFTGDDGIVNHATAKAFAGWWKVVFGGEKLFYYFFPDGRARMARVAPKRATAQLSSSAAIGRGYWFERLGVFTLIWQTSGTVEVWSSMGGGFTIKRNNVLVGNASKLFP
jgi:hypothetical protein